MYMKKMMIIKNPYYNYENTFILECEDCGYECIAHTIADTERQCPYCFPKILDNTIAGNRTVYIPVNKKEKPNGKARRDI